MTLQRSVSVYACGWVLLITLLHATFNLHAFAARNDTPGGPEQYKLGYLPVTCHLTCPVTHFINEQLHGKGPFAPVRFNGFPELKEAFLSGYTRASFILAPMAMALREQGVPIKFVYLGHRDGTAVMVRKDSNIYRMQDLRGKRVAVPSRYSNQRLLIFKALNDAGMSVNDIELLEMSPPDMPAALEADAVDAICSGEPFMAQTELDGYGRVLWLTKDVWPNFISCVLAVDEDMIKHDRAAVQALVDGIAKSGRWLDKSVEHRMDAAQFVAANYFNQDPRLLSFVLSKPPDRVTYTKLALARDDFADIEKLAVQSGILKGKVHFDDYADISFSEHADLQAWSWNSSAPKGRP